jgi:septum formation protein
MLPIILASASPRRSQLLLDAGLQFQINTNHGVDEETITNQLLQQTGTQMNWIPETLAKCKAQAIASTTTQHSIIISADTIVVINNQILGKPNDAAHALEMLVKLNGHKHVVITGVCLINTQTKKIEVFHEQTEVYFKRLTIDDLKNYIDVYKPMDKAGSYAIQEWIGLVAIEKINGCYYNVMGLPVSRLFEYLKLM